MAVATIGKEESEREAVTEDYLPVPYLCRGLKETHLPVPYLCRGVMGNEGAHRADSDPHCKLLDFHGCCFWLFLSSLVEPQL